VLFQTQQESVNGTPYVKRNIDLTAENQRLRADGERLDWLANHPMKLLWSPGANSWISPADGVAAYRFNDDLRSAIDAARKEG